MMTPGVKKICQSLLAVFLLIGSNACPAGADTSQLVERPKRQLFAVLSLKSMSESTKELAEQLEIMPFLDELYSQDHPPALERKIVLREKIMETILESYFDAASVQAEADREQIHLGAIREKMTNKRDKEVEINNATNFIASGTLNTVGSVLGFTNRLPPFPGNLNQMLSGVVSMALSTYALKQNNGGKIKQLGQSTLLAELFGRPVNERTSYPESVWRFLHGSSVDVPGNTRLQVLEEHWIKSKNLDEHGSRREKEKIDLICGADSTRKLITLDDLNDEISMIADIGAVSELMSHHLRDLLRMIDSDVIE